MKLIFSRKRESILATTGDKKGAKMANLCKLVNIGKQIIFSQVVSNVSIKSLFLKPNNINLIPKYHFKNWYSHVMHQMKKRRLKVGPEPLRHRKQWNNWNYQAELYAFSKRLNEEFSEDTLKKAFTHKSYIEQEEQKRKELGVPIQDVPLNLKENSDLISLGHETMNNYIKTFLRHHYEALPEEGISAVHSYLMSDDVLSHVSSNIGTSDLILCADFPPEKSTLAMTLKALVGALEKDVNKNRAELFVLDFVCPQLIGKDVFDIWDIPNPISILTSLLEKHNCSPLESRLVWQSGCNTIEAVYHVAMFSNKVFLGQGPGETIAIAEEMAAYDALRRLFQVTLSQNALPVGNQGRNLKLCAEGRHPYVAEWHSEGLLENLK